MSKNPPSSSSPRLRLLLLLPLTLMLLLINTSYSLGAPPPPEDRAAALAADPRAARNPKLDSVLADVAAVARVSQAKAIAQARSQSLRLSGDRVHVQLVTEASVLQPAIHIVTQAGGEVTGVGYDDTLIQGWLPVNALERVAARDEVYYIRRPVELYPLENLYVGGATTEGLAALNGPAWHAAGYTGSGVKIAVIDTGFLGYPGLLGTDLPASVTVKNFVDGESDAQVDGRGPHGTAAAEIIHDVAPDAQIYLAKVLTEVDLAEAVAWLMTPEIDVDIISTSVGAYISTPGDGTGIFADLVSQARSAGILWATAAGNDRAIHWGGVYNDIDGDNFHEFANGEDVNCFTYPYYSTSCDFPFWGNVNIFVRWSDWDDPVDQDYDLHLVRWDGTEWVTVASSTNVQNGTPGQRPTEWIAATIPLSSTFSPYGFRIEHVRGDQPVNFEVFVPELNVYGYRLQQFLYARSITNLGDSPGAITVAAIDVSSFALESYSSEGPTNGPGGAATGGFIKPDISGYDNVSTVSYGLSPFGGTSAATPHVAGAAALVLSAYPGYTPDQLQSFLEGRAVDISSPGIDTRSGYGRLYLGDPPGADNTPPTLSGLPDQTLPMNGSLDPAIDLWAYADDTEDADSALSFAISNVPAISAGVTITASHYVAIHPAPGWSGTTQVEVQVQDSGGLTTTGTFTVTISNTAPTLAGLPDQTLPMNSSLDPAIDLWAYADDTEDADSALSFAISNAPAMGAGVTITASHYVAIHPAPGWSGTTQVEVQVQDSGGLTATGTFSVSVTAPVNTAPTLSGLPDQTLPMNGSLDPAIDLWAYADDTEDADPDLSFTISNAPAISVGVTITASHYVAIHPAPGWSGTTQAEVQVQDSGGLTATDTFSVSVTGDDSTNPLNFIYLPIILRN